MAERLAFDIAADLRGRDNPLLDEAADKLDGLIEDLARAENARDEARAEVATALAGWDKAQADRLALTRECDSLARRCSVRFEETGKLYAQLGEAQRAVHHRLGHRGDVEACQRDMCVMLRGDRG